MLKEKRQYRAYLLRIWQIKDAGKLVWRASVEDPHTSERQGFVSIEALIGFLLNQAHYDEREYASAQNNNEIE